MKRIGFLATGSEIITGEVLNRDSALMAQQLQSHGVSLGEQLVVDDNEANLKAGLAFLFDRHDMVITTGGLGPTADDRTRDLIANFIGQALVFHQPSWDWIVQRFQQRNIPLTDNNKQQAYFPRKATILSNDRGSADGCLVEHQGKTIVMLPGPPSECMPMFERDVLPYIKAHGFTSDIKLYRWRLMGVSESFIACELDAAVAKPYQIEIAYRAAFPYIDIKVSLDAAVDNTALIDQIDTIVSPYFVTHELLSIPDIVKRDLSQYLKTPITIDDQATHGKLQQAVSSPETLKLLHFSDSHPQLIITGLDDYWQDQDVPLVPIHIEIHLDKGKPTTAHYDIPMRGEQTLDYAVAFCCAKLLEGVKRI